MAKQIYFICFFLFLAKWRYAFSSIDGDSYTDKRGFTILSPRFFYAYFYARDGERVNG